MTRFSDLWHVVARIAGMHTSEDPPLEDMSPQAIAEPGQPNGTEVAPRYQGFHEAASFERITGWVWDSTRPDTPIDVDIYDRDALRATVTADTFRQDLLNAGKGNGMHAFVYTPPAGLKDGQLHVISVKISGTNIDLKHTPKSICCQAGLSRYQGAHGRTDCTGIYGWAWDSSRPDTPIEVEIYDGDTLLATVSANQFHQSLHDAGKGDGRHLFLYAIPERLKDRQPHTIRVRIAGTAFDLKNTPKTIMCPVE